MCRKLTQQDGQHYSCIWKFTPNQAGTQPVSLESKPNNALIVYIPDSIFVCQVCASLISRLLDNFIKVQFTYHTIHQFQQYHSMFLSMFLFTKLVQSSPESHDRFFFFLSLKRNPIHTSQLQTFKEEMPRYQWFRKVFSLDSRNTVLSLPYSVELFRVMIPAWEMTLQHFFEKIGPGPIKLTPGSVNIRITLGLINMLNDGLAESRAMIFKPVCKLGSPEDCQETLSSLCHHESRCVPQSSVPGTLGDSNVRSAWRTLSATRTSVLSQALWKSSNACLWLSPFFNLSKLSTSSSLVALTFAHFQGVFKILGGLEN